MVGVAGSFAPRADHTHRSGTLQAAKTSREIPDCQSRHREKSLGKHSWPLVAVQKRRELKKEFPSFL